MLQLILLTDELFWTNNKHLSGYSRLNVRGIDSETLESISLFCFLDKYKHHFEKNFHCSFLLQNRYNSVLLVYLFIYTNIIYSTITLNIIHTL
jgi:hypothetical protein